MEPDARTARGQEQIAHLERADRLKLFLPTQLAELIVSSGDESLLESHRRQIAVVFCDLRGFTAFSETAEPEEVMAMLQEYHDAMGALISRIRGHRGALRRRRPDGVFQRPDPLSRTGRAGGAAWPSRCATGCASCRATWRRRGHELGFGVGIAPGYATLGTIGFEGRFHYGAIGSVVNLASRLCDEARDSQILVSQRVYAALEGRVDCDSQVELSLKGFTPSGASLLGAQPGVGRARLSLSRGRSPPGTPASAERSAAGTSKAHG